MANDETLDSTNPPQREQNVTTEQMRLEQWLAVRKEAGHHIDAETAEVDWGYAEVLDPYGVDPPDQEISLRRAGVFRSLSRKRHLGMVWRSARRDPGRLVAEGRVTVGVSDRYRQWMDVAMNLPSLASLTPSSQMLVRS
jgi:hypothetical protein